MFGEKLQKIDLIILTEINVKDFELNQFQIDNFEMYALCRDERRGGGVLIYVKEGLIWEEVDLKMISAEMLMIKIESKGYKPLHVIAMYSTPPPSTAEFLKEYEEILDSLKVENLVIAGDMNINLKLENKIVNDYKTLMAANGLTQAINKVTRERVRGENVTKTIIDHLYYRGKLEVRTGIIKQAIADHYLITANIKFEKKVSKKDNFNKKNKIKNETVDEIIKTVDWENMFNENETIGANYSRFCEEFGKIYKKTIGEVTKTKNKIIDNSRKNFQVQNLLRKKHESYRLWQNNPHRDEYRINFNKVSNKIKKVLRNENFRNKRKRFIESIGNPRKMWNAINLEVGKKKKKDIDEVITKNIVNKLNLTEKQVANNFGKQFKEQIEKLILKCDKNIISPKQVTREVRPRLKKWETVKEAQIKKIISEMDKNKSPGTDAIRIKDIKRNSRFLVGYITKLINKMLKDKKLPAILKQAIVRPIYKAGKHTNYSNYRPLSILNSMEKILEKCVYDQLYAFIKKNNMLSKNQYGFQKGKSTGQALLDFSDLINSKLNDNNHIFVLFVDFSKAFELINHQILLKKMKNMGIEDDTLEWFRDYLSLRKIIVKINSTYSDMLTTSTGIPTGSLLGPLLYLLYVNDMTEYVQSKTRILQYADDTVMISSAFNRNIALQNLQTDLNRLQTWAHDNKLVINGEKTKLMNIKSTGPREIANLTFHDHECLHKRFVNCLCSKRIQQIYEYKYLGLVVDTYFSHEPHVNFIKKKLKQASCMIYNFQFYTTKNILKSIYHALVESHLNYGIETWGFTSESNILSLARIQNSIVKTLVPKSSKCATLKQMYMYLDILPLSCLIKYRVILKNYFKTENKVEPRNPYETRDKEFNSYFIPRYNNKHGQRVMNFIVPSIFNKIPKRILQLDKFQTIKKDIKNWLYSTMDEC